MNKKYFLLAIIVIFLVILPLSILTGCGGDGDDETNKITQGPTVTQPTTTPVQCKGEGETIPVIANPPECCEGLDMIPPKSPDIVGVKGICTAKCGDDFCNPEAETTYNCPQDCPIKDEGIETSAKMVYKIGYGDTFDNAYLASPTIEMASGIQSYIWDVSFDPPLARSDQNGVPVEITGGSMGFGKTSLDLTLFKMNIRTMGFELAVSQSYTFPSEDHGAPLTIGQKWSTDELTKFEPPLMGDVVATYDVEVVGLEDVTVPAGTFECYKVVYTMVTENGVPLDNSDRQSVFWWDAHNDFLLVKILDTVNFKLPMTYELMSYTQDYLAP